MDGWKQDKQWADQFMPGIKKILGLHLIGEASEDEDQERNTDLIVLKMEAVRIACRLRRPEYYTRYKDEFTIRTSRRGGIKTELAKIIEKFGDYIFYGIASEEPGILKCYTLANLNVFRLSHSQMLAKLPAGVYPGIEKSNRDGSSGFRVFKWSDFPADFIVAQEGVLDQ